MTAGQRLADARDGFRAARGAVAQYSGAVRRDPHNDAARAALIGATADLACAMIALDAAVTVAARLGEYVAVPDGPA